jgi:hypothetical protein
MIRHRRTLGGFGFHITGGALRQPVWLLAPALFVPLSPRRKTIAGPSVSSVLPTIAVQDCGFIGISWMGFMQPMLGTVMSSRPHGIGQKPSLLLII